MADIYMHYVNAIVNAVGSTQLDWDVLAEIPGMKEWNKTMRQSDIAQKIEAGRAASMPEFMTHVKAQIQAAQSK
jgi:glutathione S-transferase